ncbi:hypothetical protein FITA111629_08510 [Filibacter tadaridae]|uniref:Uncharacterized protein n=1 Tax=Filibacter tadaridae TaxID=2483811 RepID=A0A3P5X405_9BACL|nr:hypothetical protein [Filibacter tadaridae]VDC25990.1 hypothetical protein FILTAD_01407 [Filibacter tadaridae]
MKDLLSAIDYLRHGREMFPTFAFFDNKKGMPLEELAKLPNTRSEVLHINTIKYELPILSKKCEAEMRAFCFYPNGAKLVPDIDGLRFLFVDLDSGSKEEQLELINSAPLPPTLVYTGRRGYKLLYALKNARWDRSNKSALNECKIYAENIQRQLIEYLKGDTTKTNINAAFRLPFTNNYKDFAEKGVVYTEEIVLFEPSHVYTLEQLSEAFPESTKKVRDNDSSLYGEYTKEVREIIDCLIGWLELEGLSYTEYDGKLSYQCPIHDDGTPSAFMYYTNLVCRCSNGGAGLDCAIDKGKSLRWVAKAKGWTDLEALCKKLDDKIAEEYEKISLVDMQSTELVPLQPAKVLTTGHVKAVLDKVVSTMKGRGIVVNKTTTDIFANIIHELNLQTDGVTVCPLEPGGGKSTIMVAHLKYMLDQNLVESGTILVVERIETAKWLLEQLGQYSVFIEADGKARDVPECRTQSAAFVMESAYTYKGCKKKPKKYHYGECRSCPFKEGCKVPRKHQEQKGYPIVIMTHARLKMEAGGLDRYRKWRCIDGNEYERKRIIIDEKPPIVEVISVHRPYFDQFLYDLHALSLDIPVEELVETKALINQLREQLMGASSGEKLLPINPDFVFPYSKTWYKKYSGDNVNLLKDIEYVIQNGGRVNYNPLHNIMSKETNRTVQYDFSGYHVTILDGTAKVDMEYRALQSHQMLDVPPVKSYEHLTFFVDCSMSSGKAKLIKDAKILVDFARNISIISTKETVLVLCFKPHKSSLENQLSREIKEGRVLVNHFGNVKGSNDYSRCTALVLVGITHKGDPTYINKHEAICGEVEDTKVQKRKDVRRFNDLDIETIKLNDQVVDMIQDILRICIRNNGATAQAKVYMMTKDVAFVNILRHYFTGCKVEDWNMSGTYPEWYEKLSKCFKALKLGEVITKVKLRDMLGLEGEAGGRQLRRLAKKKLYTKLLSEHSIAEVNNRKYKKVDRLEVELDQAVL